MIRDQRRRNVMLMMRLTLGRWGLLLHPFSAQSSVAVRAALLSYGCQLTVRLGILKKNRRPVGGVGQRRDCKCQLKSAAGVIPSVVSILGPYSLPGMAVLMNLMLRAGVYWNSDLSDLLNCVSPAHSGALQCPGLTQHWAGRTEQNLWCALPGCALHWFVGICGDCCPNWVC